MPAETYNSENKFKYLSYQEKRGKARRIQTPSISKSLDSVWARDDKLTSDDNDEVEEVEKNAEYLESTSVMKIIDLISEGPIEGFANKNGDTLDFFQADKATNLSFLQSVYFDETQIYNPESQAFNFRVFDIDFRRGLEIQDPLPNEYEFAAQTTQKGIRLIPSNSINIPVKSNLTKAYKKTTSIGKELKDDFENIYDSPSLHNYYKSQETHLFPVVHTIVNPLVETVVVSLQVHVLSKQRVGKRSSKIVSEEASFLIYVGNEDGSFNIDNPSLCEVCNPHGDEYTTGEFIYNDTGGYFVKVVKGIATSDYVFENIFHLPPNPNNVNRVIRVFRLEADMGYDSKSPQIECSLHSVTEIIPYKLFYPNSAIIGTTIDASAFADIPNRKFDLKLLKMKVPSNYIPDTKEYRGNWNGRFKNLLDRGGQRAVDPDQEFEVIKRGKTGVENKAAASSKVKIVTAIKKFGSGSLFFDNSLNLNTQQDYAKRISITKQEKTVALENEDSPNLDLRVGDFGFSDFTIEFYIKVSEAQVKTIHNTNGVQDTTGGRAGFYKTIISSQEGSPPCTGANRSDDELVATADDSKNGITDGVEQHPFAFETVRNDGHTKQVFGNEKKSISLPISGNWSVEIGTYGDAGQILFRYFTGTGYWKISNRGDSWGAAHKPRSHAKQLTSSAVEEQVQIKSKTRVYDDTWHHVAIVRSGDNFKIYIDGVEDTDPNSNSTYDGDVRGFVFRSGNQAGAGLINIGNDRAIRQSSVGSGTTAKLHSSFNGYLDHIHVIRKCKYTANFNTKAWPGGGSGASPTRSTDLIDNEKETVFLLTADGQANNSTTVEDYNPSIVLASEIFDYKANSDNAMLQWTDNPAWIFYDLVTNKRYGLGKYGVAEDFVNKWNIYELAKHCDQLVKTGFTPKHVHRNFDVVDDDNKTVTAGGTRIKLKGFENQSQFIEEFPENSIIAIYDLNDDEQSVHRRIRYLRSSARKGKKTIEGNEKLLLSYEPTVSGDPNSAGDAIIKIERLVSQEEALLIDPSLRMRLLMRKMNTSDNAIQSLKEMVLDYMEEKDDDYVLNANFNIGQKINTTSLTGVASTEFENEFDILEPRFSCNLYITTAVDAFKVLNDLASAFRGLTYIVGGRIFASFDKKREPIMNFTNSNIKNGMFRYAGSPKTARFTSALVRYVDKYENFRPKVEYVEDAQGIVKYGLIEKELVAFGCTSRGQARRLGEWFLFSSQLETEAVEFTGGKEASYLRPGDVVKIIDKNKTRKRYGGRLLNVDGLNGKVTLDSPVDAGVVGQIITITMPQSFETLESLNQKVSEKRGITDEELAAQRAPQIKEFEITAIEDNDGTPKQNTILTLTGAGGDDLSGIGKIKPGAVWILQNNETNTEIKEVLYRVMSVEEKSPAEYSVSCLEYNDAKFDAVEKESKLEKSRYVAVSKQSRPDVVKDVRVSITDSGEDGLDRSANVTFTRISPHVEGDVIETKVNVRAGSVVHEDVNVIAQGGTVTHTFYTQGQGSNGETINNVNVPLNTIEGEIESVDVTIKNKDEVTDDQKGAGIVEWCGGTLC
jgi:predicted phage tail protein